MAAAGARGNPSVAIGVDMHLTALLNVIRRWRMALAGGQEQRAGAFAAFVRRAPARRRDGGAISEPGQHRTRGDDRRAHADGVAHRRAQGFYTMAPEVT